MNGASKDTKDKKNSKDKDDQGIDHRKVTKEEAAFVLGSGGKTKAKLATVSGAQIDLLEGRGERPGPSAGQLEIRGTVQQRKRALKYVEFVVAQRIGPVRIDNPDAHDDLDILTVPASTVSFITGRQGSFLRLLEEEWGTLLFFLQIDPKNRNFSDPSRSDPHRTERLAIFGPQRSRRGAQLKVMAAAEMKQPGYFTKNIVARTSPEEGFATDTVVMNEEDYSYALGKGGATRRKLARASNCIVEYIGRFAHFSGVKAERTRAREYLQWLLLQRVGELSRVVYDGREDCSIVMLQAACIGYVTGHRGQSLRAVEEETNTFCFVEGAADDGEDKPLLIFGNIDDRRLAEALVWERVSEVEGELDAHGGRSGHYGRKGGKKGGKGSKGKDKERDGYGNGKSRGGYREGGTAEHDDKPEERKERKRDGETSSEFQNVVDDDAAFLMGPGGKTKRKVEAVSGANLDLRYNRLEIFGLKEEREKAKRYVKLVMAQRAGPVHLEEEDMHDDLTIVEVPAEAVSFVTGKQGSFLRLVEVEFGTLLFFLDFGRNGRRDQLERLAIFGAERERRGAELKVMAAIELKRPGHFQRLNEQLAKDDKSADVFTTETMTIEEEDFSYALGKGGATRKKLARASGCVIEYVGRLAYLSGLKQERKRARDYLGWLLQQRVGPVEVDYAGRGDVTVLMVPKDCVGFVTGHKGTSLRAVEDSTGTFCFVEGGRDDPQRDPKPLLVFGPADARKNAEERLQQRIDQKLAEGWVHEDGSKGSWDWHGRYGGKGGQNAKGASQRASSPLRSSGFPAASPAAPQLAPAEEAKADGPEEEEGAWGDWGGSSGDEDTPAPASVLASGAEGASAALSAASAPTKASSTSGCTPFGYASVAAAASAGSAQPASTDASPYCWQALPPQLVNEEAWPEMGGPAPKAKRRGRGSG